MKKTHCVSYLLHSRMVIHPGMGPKPSNVQCIVKFIYVSCLFIDMANKRKGRHLANGVYREQRNMNSRFIVLCGVSVGQMRNSEKPANNTCRYSVLIFINLQMTWVSRLYDDEPLLSSLPVCVCSGGEVWVRGGCVCHIRYFANSTRVQYGLGDIS